MTYDKWLARTGPMPDKIFWRLAAAGLLDVAPQCRISRSLYERAMQGDRIPAKEIPVTHPDPLGSGGAPRRREKKADRVTRIAGEMRARYLTQGSGCAAKAAAINRRMLRSENLEI